MVFSFRFGIMVDLELKLGRLLFGKLPEGLQRR